MLDTYWFHNEMQTTITLLGGPHYLIRHSSGKLQHSLFSTCTFLYYITATLYILAQYKLVQAALKLNTKQKSIIKMIHAKRASLKL